MLNVGGFNQNFIFFTVFDLNETTLIPLVYIEAYLTSYGSIVIGRCSAESRVHAPFLVADWLDDPARPPLRARLSGHLRLHAGHPQFRMVKPVKPSCSL